MNKLIIILALFLGCLPCMAQDINLPAPKRTGGKPLMDALNERQTDRDFSDKELTMQTLSDLVWAANGFNREAKRTAPSSQDKQEIDLYVFLKTGVYFYNAKNQTLLMKVAGDHRAKAGRQDFVGIAPVNIIFVTNSDKLPNRDDTLIDCGFISQNVYLFCASEGLISVVRGQVDKVELHKLLGLTDKQEVLLGQTVGFKK